MSGEEYPGAVVDTRGWAASVAGFVLGEPVEDVVAVGAIRREAERVCVVAADVLAGLGRLDRVAGGGAGGSGAAVGSAVAGDPRAEAAQGRARAAGWRTTWGPVGLGTSAARPAGARRPVPGLGCPWPVRTSPHLERAREHTADWMYRFGLVEDPRANARQLREWRIGELAGMCFPDATAEGLDLACDLMGWYFAPFDDLFDGELGRDPVGAGRLLGEMTAIVDRPLPVAGPGQPPVVRAFADLFRRSVAGMSLAWRRRAARNWKDYLAGQFAEVVDRRGGPMPDPTSCLHRRVRTTSTQVVCDLAERVEGYEVDNLVAHMPGLSELRLIAAEIVAIDNDVVSADREKARGDLHNNLLLVLETTRGLTRHAALQRLAGMLRERYERFERLERHTADPGPTPGPPTSNLRRNVAGLRDIVAGTCVWENTTGRGRT